jgi:hypothetical protein
MKVRSKGAYLMRRTMLLAVLACSAVVSAAAGQGSAAAPGTGPATKEAPRSPNAGAPLILDEKDKAVSARFREHARAFAAKLTAEHFAAVEEAEMLCWMELRQMNLSLIAYELGGDVTHLRDFAKAQENLRSSLKKGPDGFLAWRGKAIVARRDPNRPDIQTDDIQTAFRAVWVLSRFVEIINADEGLQKEFGPLRAPLVDLMENHLVKKWNDRGYWVDLGAEGGTYRMNNLVPPGNCVSLPWEKLSIAVDGLLALHRATGHDEHMQRVIQIGSLFKRRLQLTDGRYMWYRWVPLGKWDINPSNPDKWATWIGRSPIDGWYDVEVGIAVALYHHGVVFDRTDMERFTKTQVGVCWNGDANDPQYLNCEGKPSDRKGQRYLCQGLAPFSEKLAAFLYTGAMQQERLDKKDSDWSGGILAGDWLRSKYVDLPKAAGGKPIYAAVGKRFLDKEDNRKLVEKLKFEVAEPGFKMPMTPGAMKPMPEAPDPKES